MVVVGEKRRAYYMMRFASVLAFILINYGASCKDTEADLRRLPRLYHLDDFESCMERKDGIYCLAFFEIYNELENNPLYDLIQEKSQDVMLYNRTLLRRGYCLPARCPTPEANATARFERCVDAWARRHALRARIHTSALTPHYCRAHGQPPPVRSTDDTPHRVFLYVVYAYLFMNALGTLYDLKMGAEKSKNYFLMMFSLRDNWLKLTNVQETGIDYPRGLKVLNGLKAFTLLGTITVHVGFITAQAWHYNPRFFEKLMSSPFGPMTGAITTMTHCFVLISNFLTAYNLLLFSQKFKMELWMLPILFLKRLVRLLPMYLLLTGFSATWWTQMGDGPLWPVLVGMESEICRDKFWLQAFFLQNMFEPNRVCNIQTWVMAVDTQLYILSLTITLLLIRKQKRAVPILLALLAGVTALTAYVAVSGGLEPVFYQMEPETFRELFFNARYFVEFFVLPINCVIAMVLGILLGFMSYNVQQEGAKDEEKMKPSKLMVVLHFVSLPMIFIASYFASTLLPVTDPLIRALLIPLERLAFVSFCFVFLYSSAKVKSIITDVLAWPGMRIISRVSMSVSMVHWCVNKTLAANRSTLIDSSRGLLMLDTIGVSVISFILAVPLTLIVEFPMIKLMDKLLMYLVM